MDVDCCSASVLIAVRSDLPDENRWLTFCVRPDDLEGISLNAFSS